MLGERLLGVGGGGGAAPYLRGRVGWRCVAVAVEGGDCW